MLGLSAQASGRGLLTFESGGFRDAGMSDWLAWDPDPSSDRGPSLTIRQTLGARSAGGMHLLLGRPTLAGLARHRRRSRAPPAGPRAGFGTVGDRLTATREVGLALEPQQREYRLGWRFALAGSGPTAFELALEGTRREHATAIAPPEHALGIRMTGRW